MKNDLPQFFTDDEFENLQFCQEKIDKCLNDEISPDELKLILISIDDCIFNR